MTANLSTARAWNALRRRALEPLHLSESRTTQTDRDEFLQGATLLRFHGENARAGYHVLPQQTVVVDMMAAGRPRNAVQLPRRSTKTTTLIALGLGRAAAREDYRVAYLPMTSGKAGRSRFLRDVVPPLTRLYPDERNRPFVISKGTGREAVTFPNGGFMAWLGSIDDLRGEAFDLIILDEAQAADPEKAQEVIAAALPTLDTRRGSQIVVGGTATNYTAGNLLAQWLQHGRDGGWGIVEYAVDPDTTDDVLETWETVEPLVLRSHPGVGTLTTLEAIRGNYEAMTHEQFGSEYLGLWGNGGVGRILFNPETWADSGVNEEPLPPARFGLAMSCSFTGRVSCLVAAWRDDDGKAHVYVTAYQLGTQWLLAIASDAALKHDLPLIYDKKSGPIQVEVDAMRRLPQPPRLLEFDWADIRPAHALLVGEANRHNVVHYKQDMLDSAVAIAVRRQSADSWAIGRPPRDLEADISPLQAAAMALHFYDNNPEAEFIGPIMGNRAA